MVIRMQMQERKDKTASRCVNSRPALPKIRISK
jgi:hypothetical protein